MTIHRLKLAVEVKVKLVKIAAERPMTSNKKNYCSGPKPATEI